MRAVLYIAAVIAASLMTAGCYTRFALAEGPDYGMPENVEIQVDSAGDTVRVIRQVDTVEIKDRQVCYWERDWFGRRVLRCYRTNYDDDWQYYSDYPWWYTDRSYYELGNCHCPYHITYHSYCRYCWDYCNMYCRDCYSGSSRGIAPSGGYSSPHAAPLPPSSAGTSRSGSGQDISPSKTSKPRVAGPRPEAPASVKILRKKTTDEIKETPQNSFEAGESAPVPQTIDSARQVRPEQPRRRYGRTR